MTSIDTRLTRLETTTRRPDARPLFLGFPTEESYLAALAAAQAHGGALWPRHSFVKVYVGFDPERV